MFLLDEISRTSRLHKIHENKIHENMKNSFIVHESRYFPSVKSNADGTHRLHSVAWIYGKNIPFSRDQLHSIYFN